ncbi:MAG: PEP-CTERM sorting domain-containing protein [Planctomycetes bacterium]|nr:PEP-CTERM sorting domain-containing protein [Planctomycetota bacterium]
MRSVFCFLVVLLLTQPQLSADIVISGYMANPGGTDSPFEYVQLVATKNIDFAVTNYSLVVANNGVATSNGWVSGGSLTYKFNMTSGTVNRGDVFYVGGSGKLINGSASTDISSQNWIRAINTGTTGGDGFGNSSSAGVVGNGGANADGIAVFSGISLTSSSKPLDALFYGTGVGNSKPASGGYVMPDNDRYSNAQGTFGNGTNTFVFGDPATTAYTKLTGTYNLNTNSWDVARTGSFVTAPTSLGDISSGIVLFSSVPEPSSLLGLGFVASLGMLHRVRRRLLIKK